MKKLITFLVLLLPISTYAREFIENFEWLEPNNSVEIAVGEPYQLNTINGHEYVDLGLPSGTLWATTNIGANNPEDNGSYYAWGDIYPYVGWYIFWDGEQYTKYCTAYKFGIPDGKTELDIEDDAAAKVFGDGWRIPNSEQLGELINNCTITKSSLNGKVGCLFTGPNGNSIFLPNTGGCKYGSQPYNNDEAFYWSRNLYYSSNEYATLMVINDTNIRMGFGNRDRGLFIRPVTYYDPTSVNSIIVKAPSEIVEIYDLQGHKIPKLQKGLNIVHMGDGTTKKVVVK